MFVEQLKISNLRFHSGMYNISYSCISTIYVFSFALKPFKINELI